MMFKKRINNKIRFISLDKYIFEIYKNKMNIYKVDDYSFCENFCIEKNMTAIELMIVCENW
ncbi:MAG: hypothetical protein ACRDA5_00610, partial [Clostridium sp.]